MTDKEKAIVAAYTGYAMLTGEKLDMVHQYIQALLGRPVYTHELAFKSIWGQIREAAREDFVRLCRADDNGEEAEEIWRLRTGDNANC